MSFCIRSISSGGGRYVPTYVASGAQGCANARRISGQPPPRHCKPVAATSAFLNQFFGCNTPLDVRDQCAVTSLEDSSSIAFPQPRSLQVLSYDGIGNVGRETRVSRVPYNGSRELFSEEINFTSNKSPLADSLVLINNRKHYNNEIPLINGRNNFIVTNHKTNFSSLGTCTKEKAKVRFSNTISKISSTLKQKNTNESSTTNKGPDKESLENLERVYQTLSIDLPKFFVKSLDYKIYHPEIEFVNNIRGTTTRGVYPYVKQMALLRTIGHLKYAYVKLDVLKITMHTQDNTVRVRWRINGITGIKILLAFWKFKIWKMKDSLKEQESWYDGFSTFYVGEDGLVYRHVVDKVVPSQDAEEDKPKGLPSKLASQLTFSSLN